MRLKVSMGSFNSFERGRLSALSALGGGADDGWSHTKEGSINVESWTNYRDFVCADFVVGCLRDLKALMLSIATRLDVIFRRPSNEDCTTSEITILVCGSQHSNELIFITSVTRDVYYWDLDRR